MKIVLNPSPAELILKLSAREFEVFCDIAIGASPAETAERLSISVKTVSTYRQRIMDKLKLTSNQQVAVLAYKHKITKIVGDSNGLWAESGSDGRAGNDLGTEKTFPEGDGTIETAGDVQRDEGGDVLPDSVAAGHD